MKRKTRPNKQNKRNRRNKNQKNKAKALNVREAVCGGTLLMPEVPSACRKVLFGSRAAGLLATDSVARRSSLSVTGRVLVTFLLICVSRSIYICRIDLLVLESMYLRFQTAPYLHCAALSLSSRRSLFMSYVLRRSVSSWKVVVRWTQHCLTAPSRVQWPSNCH